VFGRDLLVLVVANALLAVLLPIPLAYLANRLYPEVKTTRLLMLVVLFAPLSMLYLSLPMRDTLALFLFTVLLAAIVRSAETGGHPRPLVVILPVVGALWYLRFELVLITALGCLVAVAAVVHEQANTSTRSNLALAAGFLLAGVSGFTAFEQKFPISFLNEEFVERATGGAAYLEWMRYDGWVDVVLTLPVRALFFQFAPFPLHVNSLFDLLAVFPLPGLIVLAIAAYRSLLARPVRNTPAALLLTVYLAGIAGFAIIDANFGTTVRHRIPFVFLLVVFAAPVLQGWERRFGRLRQVAGEIRKDDSQR